MARIRFDTGIAEGAYMHPALLLPIRGTVRLSGGFFKDIVKGGDRWDAFGLSFSGNSFNGTAQDFRFYDFEKLRMLVTNIPKLATVLTFAIQGDAARAYDWFLAGADSIVGSGYKDHLEGGLDNDTIRGGNGNDVLSGEEGLDSLTGGYGNDHFYFQKSMASTNRDIITDFKAADDTLVFDNDGFAGLGAAGRLTESRFRAGYRALDASDRILYNDVSGKVFYDRDGSGPAAAVLIAEVGANKHLTLADFWVAD